MLLPPTYDLAFEEKGNTGLTVTILGRNKTPLKAIISIQQLVDINKGEYKIEAISEFYQGDSRISDIRQKMEDDSELQDLLSYYEAQVRNRQLLSEFLKRQKGRQHSNRITRIILPFRDAIRQYAFFRNFYFSLWSSSGMVNIYTICEDGANSNQTDKIIGRTVIELDGDVLTAINSSFLNTHLSKALFLLHLSNVALATQFVRVRTTEIIIDASKNIVQSFKKATMYMGFAGFAIDWMAYSIPAISNNNSVISSQLLLPLVTPFIWPLVAAVVRKIAPQIISFFIRRALRGITK
jgi:hypothetical protein